MKTVLGIDSSDNIDDIAAYINEGADEFFAGFIPPMWYNHYGWEVNLNRRENGKDYQFIQYQDLEKAISAIHQYGKEIFITLNAHQYTREQIPLIREVVLEIEKLNPDGYIVADLALMVLLREWGVNRALHLSTGAACFNSEVIRYFHRRIGIKRVVIPRKMSLREMKILIEKCKDLDIEFEVMVIYNDCFFNDEYCFSWHSGITASFCSYFGLGTQFLNKRFPNGWKKTIQQISKEPQSQFQEDSALNNFLRSLSLSSYEREIGPRQLLNLEGITKKSKSLHLLSFVTFAVYRLCAIKQLREIGVSVVKVPTRGTQGKIKYLQMVSRVVRHPNPTKEFCKSLINSVGVGVRFSKVVGVL